MNIDRLLDDIIRRLLENYDLNGIILFGSHAKGQAHSKSDIDLYVVGDDYQEKTSFYYYNNVPIQILWRSIDNFKEKMFKSTRGKPIYLTGEILYDKTGLIREYFDKAKKDNSEKPKKLSEKEKYLLKISLSTELETIEGLIEIKNYSGAKLLINDLLIDGISLFYDINNWWFPSKKNIITDFINRNNNYGQICESILLSNNLKESYKSLKIFVNAVLEKCNGKLNSYEIIW